MVCQPQIYITVSVRDILQEKLGNFNIHYKIDDFSKKKGQEIKPVNFSLKGNL